MDRQTVLGVLVLVSAAVVLAVGATGMFIALRDDGVDLPSEGNLTDILEDSATESPAPDSPAAAGTEAPEGPAPTRMVIPRLYIDAPVIVKGLTASNLPDVPDRPDQVAWYPSFSVSPGRPGNAVFAGHVDWQTPQGAPIPGVFYRLREMKVGDLIEVTLEDGNTLQYRVRANVATAYDDPKILQVMQPTRSDVLTLITCGGAWVKDGRQENGGNYSHRVVVRAERVHALADNAPAG
jgi:LPXTG-site transpeptidase (sortase) family protein